MTCTPVDIGVFIHNEEEGLPHFLQALAEQTLLADPARDPIVHLLLNGCVDASAEVARATLRGMPAEIAARFAVHVLPEPGKSRTWNRFVSELSREGAGALVFLDADISFPDARVLAHLLEGLERDPQLWAFNSQPVRDLSLMPKGALQKLIVRSGAQPDHHRKAICGQCYAARAESIRRIRLPIGLPVEDGFIRAMILTEIMTDGTERLERIDGDDVVRHVYPSETTLKGLIRHQVRQMIGCAINLSLYDELIETTSGGDDAARLLAHAAQEPGWLQRLIVRRRGGRFRPWVPTHFWLARPKRILRRRDLRLSRRLALAAGVFGFETICYVSANQQMARGGGPGFW